MSLLNLKLRVAQLHCVHLALSHYENFFVLGPLTPLRKVPHLAALYAFSRYADDLADRIEDPEEAAQLLDRWQRELEGTVAGYPTHKITRALRATIDRFDLPPQLLFDLLSAFKQDLTIARFETFEQLRDYTRRSADPVGRLVLRLYSYDDPELDVLSDQICTGLQLANFCQDVREDADRDRIYIPLDECRQFDVDPAEILDCRSSLRLERLLYFQNVRAYKFLVRGLPLAEHLTGRLKLSVRLFALGGLQILENLRNDPQSALRRRVKLSLWQKRRTLTASFKRPKFCLPERGKAPQVQSDSLS